MSKAKNHCEIKRGHVVVVGSTGCLSLMSSRTRAASHVRPRGTSQARLARSLSDAVAQHDVALFDAVIRRYEHLGLQDELELARTQRAAIFGHDTDSTSISTVGDKEAAPGHGSRETALDGEVVGAERASDPVPSHAVEDAEEAAKGAVEPGAGSTSVSSLSEFVGGASNASKSNLAAFLSAPAAPAAPTAPAAPMTKLGSFLSTTPSPAMPSLPVSISSVPTEGIDDAKSVSKGRRRSSVMQKMASGDAETRAFSIAKLTGRDRSASHIGECCYVCAL